MLDTQTKRRIDDCRDILVGKLPDPKAQIEQITIGLIYKFMDDMDKEAIELGGSAKFFSDDYAKYSWDALFDTKVTASEMLKLYSEAIESMEKNPNIPQLFRDIFNNAYLPYRDPETLKMFLKTIGEFEYTHSEKLGDAFEYLLSVMGSQGDAGQFRTPRHIIDFLVEMVDPKKTDTILDPACGTAGFLISAFKHIMNCKDAKHCVSTPEEQKRLIKNFAGYDISPDMVRLSLVNLYLHGFAAPHIHEYDTLSSEERWDENFDVVLANPPFMSPKGGIRPHKKFTIQSNRSEVLFVDYIAEHLNPKGRAGIIVPEGVIFQSGKAYKSLRKMLVENHLYAVVSLPAGVFNPYSGVKTSILLMDSEFAKTSNEILFVKIDNDGFNLGAQRNAVKGGQLEDAIELLNQFKNGEFPESPIAHTVLKSEIAKNGDYNLSGERYKVSILLSNSSYKQATLKKLCTKITDGSHNPPKGKDSGQLMLSSRNVYDNVLNYKGARYLDEIDFDRENKRTSIKAGDVLLTIVGTIGRSLVVKKEYPKFTLQRSVAVFKPKKDIVNSYFLSRIIQHEHFREILNSRAKGVAQKGIYLKELGELQIPLPPLSVQEEIVAEIEGYQKIIDGAKMVVENYKPKIDIDPAWEMVELGEVCDVKSGGTPRRNIESYWNGNIPWVGSTVCKDVLVDSAEEFITEEGLKKSSAKIFNSGTTLIALVGATIGKTGFLTFECTTNQNIAGLKPKDKNQTNDKYLFFSCQSIYNNFMRLGEGKFRMATLGFVREQKIPLPSIEIQNQIVAQIEKERELVNASKQLIEIFEQKIKERIAKVWGEKKSEEKPELSLAAESVGEYKTN